MLVLVEKIQCIYSCGLKKMQNVHVLVRNILALQRIINGDNSDIM